MSVELKKNPFRSHCVNCKKSKAHALASWQAGLPTFTYEPDVIIHRLGWAYCTECSCGVQNSILDRNAAWERGVLKIKLFETRRSSAVQEKLNELLIIAVVHEIGPQLNIEDPAKELTELIRTTFV